MKQSRFINREFIEMKERFRETEILEFIQYAWVYLLIVVIEFYMVLTLLSLIPRTH